MTLAAAAPPSLSGKCHSKLPGRKGKTSAKTGFCRIAARRSAPLSEAAKLSGNATSILDCLFESCKQRGRQATAEDATNDSPAEAVGKDQEEIKATLRVRFLPRVEILDIPHHSVYPKSIKRALWNSGKQIRKAALRSALEFAFEGRDWRTALEEDNFVTRPKCLEAEDEDQSSEGSCSSLIHPAHVFGVCE